MKFRTKETSQRIALLEACKSARVALVEWEKLCQEFVPGHVKLRPEYSDCEVGSHQAQVSIHQAINLCETDSSNRVMRESRCPMNETKHTPLPWRSSSWDELGGGRDDIRVLGANGHHVCYCDRPVIESRPLNQANADFIVRAVNTIDQITAQRDALLAACKRWIEYFQSDLPKTGEQSEAQGEEFTAAWFKTIEAIQLCERGDK